MSISRIRRKFVPQRPSSELPPYRTTRNGTRLHVYSLRDPYRLTPVASYDKTNGGWVRVGDRREKHPTIHAAVAYAAEYYDERMEPCQNTQTDAAGRLRPPPTARPLPSAGPTAEAQRSPAAATADHTRSTAPRTGGRAMDNGRAGVDVHLECAIRALTLETWEDTAHGLIPVEHHTIADELRRMDAALGRRGSTMLATLADTIDEVYTELLAAQKLLRKGDGDDG